MTKGTRARNVFLVARASAWSAVSPPRGVTTAAPRKNVSPAHPAKMRKTTSTTSINPQTTKYDVTLDVCDLYVG